MHDIEQEISRLSEQIKENPQDARLLAERGKLFWRAGRRGEAMSDYTASALIEPEGVGAQLLEYSREILDFYNKDLYNP